jgi:predicted secreted acid phosphatase
MNQTDAERLTKLIGGLAASNYVLLARQEALELTLEEVLRQLLPLSSVGDGIRKTVRRHQVAALEQMILRLGDTRPDVAAILQKEIDSARRASGG